MITIKRLEKLEETFNDMEDQVDRIINTVPPVEDEPANEGLRELMHCVSDCLGNLNRYINNLLTMEFNYDEEEEDTANPPN